MSFPWGCFFSGWGRALVRSRSSRSFWAKSTTDVLLVAFFRRGNRRSTLLLGIPANEAGLTDGRGTLGGTEVDETLAVHAVDGMDVLGQVRPPKYPPGRPSLLPSGRRGEREHRKTPTVWAIR